MLEGLSLAHAFVVAIDRSGGMAWMSSEMSLVYPGAANGIGQSIEVLLDEAAVTMSAGDEAHFKSRARAFVDELNESGRVAPARFDVGLHPARAVVEVSAFRFETDDGKILGVCMARRLAPEAPLEPELAPADPNSRLAFILDATPDAVLAIDRLGFVTSANAAAGRILGHPHRDLIDRPLRRFVKESKSATRIAESMAARGALECEEIEITRADGLRAWLSISAQRHEFARTDSTTSTETIVVIRDVTNSRISFGTCPTISERPLQVCSALLVSCATTTKKCSLPRGIDSLIGSKRPDAVWRPSCRACSSSLASGPCPSIELS
jgi:PAS domain S-box-containing protein